MFIFHQCLPYGSKVDWFLKNLIKTVVKMWWTQVPTVILMHTFLKYLHDFLVFKVIWRLFQKCSIIKNLKDLIIIWNINGYHGTVQLCCFE